MEVTATFLALLSEFQCVFTSPSYANFLRLMTGWVLTHRRRFVTDQRLVEGVYPAPATVAMRGRQGNLFLAFVAEDE